MHGDVPTLDGSLAAPYRDHMQSGQNELMVLWQAWVERFAGRRVTAALSFLLVPLVGVTGWVTSGPAIGITAAVGIAACFVFLVAFAMAHELAVETADPGAPAAPPQAAGVAVDEAASRAGTPTPGHTARLAH